MSTHRRRRPLTLGQAECAVEWCRKPLVRSTCSHCHAHRAPGCRAKPRTPVRALVACRDAFNSRVYTEVVVLPCDCMVAR